MGRGIIPLPITLLRLEKGDEKRSSKDSRLQKERKTT